MKKLNALLVDDEQISLDLLEMLLNKTGKVRIVEKISEPLKAECNIAKHKPDIVFLDMNMPIMGGLDILANIREYNNELPVVFVTAYNENAIKAIKHDIFDYLLKPINEEELNNTIEKFYAFKKDSETIKSVKIKLPIKEGIIYIIPEDILYLKADGNYTQIFLTSNEKYLSSYNMGRLAKRLDGKGFERINRNLVINSEYLYKINREKKICTLKTRDLKVELEISKSFLQKVNKILS